MIENLRHTSPAPDNDCRRTALSDSDAEINRAECVRPKKWELRRMRSLDEIKSSLLVEDYKTVAGKGRRLKKKRLRNENINVDRSQSEEEEGKCWNRKEAVVSISLASSSSNELKNDVVLQGSSSFINEEGSKGKEKMKEVPCWSHASISVVGRRREMEDVVAVELGILTRSGGSKVYDFYGVYDGHGGSQVAQACGDRFHKLLVEMVEEEDGIVDGDGVINWYKVMLESFKKMDEEVNMNGAAVATVGSTAVVAVVGEEEVVVANCGDSRAVLSRGGIAIPLSSDHKPERPDELERIELSGGKVINWNGQRVLGVLATSRSLGDQYLKPFVISEPEVTVSKRTNMDEFLILASDGLWDVISNDVACLVVRRCLDGNMRQAPQEIANSKRFNENTPPTMLAKEIENGGLAAEAASSLAELAIARGSRDNISVIVIQLKTSARCIAERVGNCSGGTDEKA